MNILQKNKLYKCSLFDKKDEEKSETIITHILPDLSEKSIFIKKYDSKKYEHDKVKLRCKDCKEPSICSHGIQKYYCKECKGNGICKHDKFKLNCIECGGSAYCIHKKFKTQCRHCKGSAFCIHDKRKTLCRECNRSERSVVFFNKNL